MSCDVVELELFEHAPAEISEEDLRAMLTAPSPADPEKDPSICVALGCAEKADSPFRTGYCTAHMLREAGVR